MLFLYTHTHTLPIFSFLITQITLTTHFTPHFWSILYGTLHSFPSSSLQKYPCPFLQLHSIPLHVWLYSFNNSLLLDTSVVSFRTF